MTRTTSPPSAAFLCVAAARQRKPSVTAAHSALIIAAVLLLLPAYSTHAARVEFEGSFYEVTNQVRNFETAIGLAASKTMTDPRSGKLIRGHLVVVSSAAEYQFLNEKLNLAGRSFWMAASDRQQEGVWRWTAGPEMGLEFYRRPSMSQPGNSVYGQYTRWTGNEPNNVQNANFPPGEDCLESIKGTWNDVPCTASAMIVIEYSPRKLFHLGLSIFEVLDAPASSATYAQAATAAAAAKVGEVSGHLAAPSTADEAEFLKMLYPDADFWLATTRTTGASSTITWSKGLQHGLAFWKDGAAVKDMYSNFDANDAQQQQPGVDACVRSEAGRNGAWATAPCTGSTDKTRVVVEYDMREIIKFGESTYEVLSDTMTWDEAQAVALARSHEGSSGHLVVIDSKRESDFLFDAVSKGFWLGATDSETEGEWKWAPGTPEAGAVFWNGGADGKAVTGMYTDWNAGEPNNAGDEHCAEARGVTNLLWNDIACGTKLTVVVEYSRTSRRIVRYGPYAYELMPNKATFEQATAEASSRTYSDASGVVATFTSVVELEYISKRFPEALSFWISAGPKSQSDRDWSWTTGNLKGVPLSDTANNWYSGMPTKQFTCAISLRARQYKFVNADCRSQAQVLIRYDTRVFKKTEESVYELVSGGANYAMARRISAARYYQGVRGHIVSIDSKTENDIVVAMSPSNIWLGVDMLSEAADKRQFVYRSGLRKGTPMWTGNADGQNYLGSYTNWNNLEPNGNADQVTEACVHTRGDGTWNDISCELQMTVVVEYPLRNVLHRGSSAYEVVTGQGAYAKASVFASQVTLGKVEGQTVVINSMEEAEFLQAFLGSSSGSGGGSAKAGAFWIAHRGSARGDWMWDASWASGAYHWLGGAGGAAHNGAYNNWAANEPSADAKKLCAIAGGVPDSSAWTTVSCSDATPRLVIEYQTVIAKDSSAYRLISDRRPHVAAKGIAAATSLDGITGHLLIVSSEQERTKILQSFPRINYWGHAEDSVKEGEWAWGAGPEKGQIFWRGAGDGAGVPGVYHTWNSGEPNNVEGEHCLEISGSSLWNDNKCTQNFGVIAEYQTRNVIYIYGVAYELLPVTGTRDEAVAIAASRRLGGTKGRLAVIQSKAVSDVLFERFADKEIWLAGQRSKGGEWANPWTNGVRQAPFYKDATGAVGNAYNNWAGGAPPAAGTGGDCMVAGGAGGTQWRTTTCDDASTRRFIVLQYPSRDIKEFQGHVYDLLPTAMTYSEGIKAAERATYRGVKGKMVVVESQAENDFLADAFGGAIWLAGDDNDKEGDWKWRTGRLSDTTFWTGVAEGTSTPGVYTNWNKGEPNNSGAGENCLEMSLLNSGLWNDLPCDKYFRVVVEYAVRDLVRTPDAIFEHVAGPDMTYQEAVNKAKTMKLDGIQGSVVAAYNLKEQHVLRDNFNSMQAFWMAGTGDGTGTFSWRTEDRDGIAFWSNGKKANGQATQWADGEPQTGVGNCIVSGKANKFSWSTTVCSGKAALIVRYDTRTLQTFDGVSYELVGGQYSFADAKALAAKRYVAGQVGTLVSSNSDKEQKFLDEKFGTHHFWLDASDAARANQWRWLSGENKNRVVWFGTSTGNSPEGLYSNWRTGEPSAKAATATTPSEDCMSNVDAFWQDDACNLKLYTVVEYRAVKTVATTTTTTTTTTTAAPTTVTTTTTTAPVTTDTIPALVSKTPGLSTLLTAVQKSPQALTALSGTANIMATNGIVHLIDTVLMLPTTAATTTMIKTSTTSTVSTTSTSTTSTTTTTTMPKTTTTKKSTTPRTTTSTMRRTTTKRRSTTTTTTTTTTAATTTTSTTTTTTSVPASKGNSASNDNDDTGASASASALDTSAQGPGAGAVAGGVIGGLLGVALLVAAAMYVRRQRAGSSRSFGAGSGDSKGESSLSFENPMYEETFGSPGGSGGLGDAYEEPPSLDVGGSGGGAYMSVGAETFSMPSNLNNNETGYMDITPNAVQADPGYMDVSGNVEADVDL
eukprot:UC1_evm1s275